MSERLTVSNVSKCVKMNKSITQKRLKTKCIYIIYIQYTLYIYTFAGALLLNIIKYYFQCACVLFSFPSNVCVVGSDEAA